MPLFESAIGGIAVSVVEGAIALGKHATNEIRDNYSQVDHHNRLHAASQAYIDNYLNRHCQIKIMPGLMKEPLDLESIYTDVKILDDRSIRAFSGLDELESTYRDKGKRSFGRSEAERINGMTVANAERFLMVLGGPGIGKSTFLRKIGLEALKKDGRLQRECIPVFLELKKFREETIDIQQKIVEEFNTCKFPAAEAFVASALEQGKLLVLFDGLDEVPSKKLNQVIEKIENFVDKHDKNRFVASCRIAAYRSSFRRFTDVTISEFDDEQIKQFIHRWFSSDEDNVLDTAKKYEGLLNQPDHKATKELAQTPLLLTFLCLVYDREQMLPNKRSTLYGQALNIILSEWSAQKRLERDPIYEGFHPDLEKEMLSEIAYESFKQDQLFFSKDVVTKRIKGFLSDTLDAPKGLNADDVLRAIEVQQGILVERATDAYSFSHLTLQEYLTALYIVEKRLEQELMTQYLADERWREIFLLVSGIARNPVNLLFEPMHRQAASYIKPYAKLQNLVKWAAVNEEAESELYQRAGMIALGVEIASSYVSSTDVVSTRSRTEISSTPITIVKIESIISNIASSIAAASAIEKLYIERIIISANSTTSSISAARRIAKGRAFALDSSIAVSSDRAIANITAVLDSNFSNHHFLRTRTLAALKLNMSQHQSVLPTSIASSDDWSLWAKQLQQIWVDALELKVEAVTFSYKELKALRDYLYATELIVRCKQSAVRVSRTAWEALERELLTWEDKELKEEE